MKRHGFRIRKRIPIQKRLLTAVLLTTILSIVIVSITGFFCIRWIRSATETTLTDQLEVNLKKNIEEKVLAVDARLAHYESYIQLMTDSIKNMYAHENEMRDSGKMIEPPGNTKKYAMTRGFSSQNKTAEKLKQDILFYSNLESIWEPIAKENKDLISTIYLGTANGLLISYDKYSYLSYQPNSKELYYNYFVSEWYKRGIMKNGIFYTNVYMDSQGRGLTVTVGSAFKDKNGQTAGVVCMDFDLKEIYEDMFSAKLDDGTFTFVLDQKETIISPDSDTLDLKKYTGLTLDEMDELKTDPDGIMQKGSKVYVSVPMKRVGWTMCACVPKSAIMETISHSDSSIWKAFLVFIIFVVLIMMIAILVVRRTVKEIIYPLELLERDIKIISDGDLSYRASVYRNDEIGDITSGMNEMVDRLNFTLNELMSSQQHADAMSRLATTDTLTGIRNKTAFDAQTKLLEEQMESEDVEFGFVMLDLNNLKLINDNYGHEKGDAAIRNLCRATCDIFVHSPVFRVGGDEFVVILKNDDYNNIDELTEKFKEMMRLDAEKTDEEPWNRVSAAIGYALYDKESDTGTAAVLARADKEMYVCKKKMKEQ